MLTTFLRAGPPLRGGESDFLLHAQTYRRCEKESAPSSSTRLPDGLRHLPSGTRSAGRRIRGRRPPEAHGDQARDPLDLLGKGRRAVGLTAGSHRGTRRLARVPGPSKSELPVVSPVVSYVVQTLITVGAISALAVLVLYGARRVGVGRPSGPLTLVGRLPLEGRRMVYLIRVGETVYVVGASEAGLHKLGEVGRQELGAAEDLGPGSFREAWARAWAKRGTTEGKGP